MLPIIYFLKYLVRSGIRTHAYSCRLRPERSALDHSAILTTLIFIFTNRVSYFNLVIQKATTAMLPIIYFLKYLVRSGIRTHAYSCRLRPERSALDHSAILTMSITHIYFYK